MVMMARWLVDIPWEHSAPFEMIDVDAGIARIARFAQACGFSSRAFELKFDEPPAGESRHAGRARRSAFDINGEGGFLVLS